MTERPSVAFPARIPRMCNRGRVPRHKISGGRKIIRQIHSIDTYFPTPLAGSRFVPVTPSNFARNLNVETAFTVLAVARTLKGQGKDVVELEIGDRPFESTASAKAAGERAIRENQ